MERALQLWIKGADEERHALHHRVQRREDRHFDGGRVAVAAQTDERADHGRDERLEGVGRRLFDEVSEAQGALLALLGRRGVAGEPLFDAFGFSIPFTTAAVVIAQAYVALPFFVMSVEGALLSRDRDVEEAVSAFGADPATVFRKVTLPAVFPGIGAGAVLAAARALGEFGATVTFAGSIPGETQTLPVAIYASLQRAEGETSAVRLAVISVAVAVGAILAAEACNRRLHKARQTS